MDLPDLRARPYLRRVIDDELDVLCSGAGALALEGAKGVGKTATAAERSRVAYSLENPAVREAISAVPSLLRASGPILIDEWQHLPSSWDVVRRAVDAGVPPGQFLLTGSASAVNPGTHSGAGRILKLRMRPLSLAERELEQVTVSLAKLLTGRGDDVDGQSAMALPEYVEEICASGFPGVRPLPGRVGRAQLAGYVERIVDRDFADLGRQLRNPDGLRRWMVAYAAATATTGSFEKVRDAATHGEGDKPARSTTIPYRDVLERLYVLDPVDAWLPTRNHIKRISSSPKHHLVDPAIAASLLGMRPEALLDGDQGPVAMPRDGTLLGALFESLVTQSVRTYAQASEARVGHFRTHSGDHEVDLIVERADGRVVAVETKLASTVGAEDTKHLRWLRDQLGPDLLDAIVITTGPFAYRRSEDGVAVVPASLLGP